VTDRRRRPEGGGRRGGAKGAREAGVAGTLLRSCLSANLAAGASDGALTAVMVADSRVESIAWRPCGAGSGRRG